MFVEYKYVPKLPLRKNTIVRAKLSGLQFEWLTRRAEEGIPVAVIVGCKAGGVFFDDVAESYEGITTEAFEARVVDKVALAAHIARCVSQEPPKHDRKEYHASYYPSGPPAGRAASFDLAK